MPAEPQSLIELRNLGPSSVNMLKAIDIHTPEELRAIGSVQAYRRIRHRGMQVSHSLLYAIEGALLDIPWQDLDPAIKVQLVQMADRIDREEAAASAAGQPPAAN